MKEKLLTVFEIVNKIEGRNSMLEYISGTDHDRIQFYIKAHNWSINDDCKVSAESSELFRAFRKNYENELHTCGTSGSSLATALRAIAKELS